MKKSELIIEIPEELDTRVKERIASLDYKQKRHIGRKSIASVIALACVTSGLLINPTIRTMASDIPVVRNIIDLFWTEPSVQVAMSKNYPVYDYKETNAEGFTLYIKETYMDPRRISMKVGLESPEGEIVGLHENPVTLKIGDSTLSFKLGVETNNPWFHINMLNSFNEGVLEFDERTNFSIRVWGEGYDFQSKEFDYNVPGDTDSFIVNLDQTLKLENEEIEIKSLSSYPGGTILDLVLSDRNKDQRLDIQSVQLVDNKGKQYKSIYGQHTSGEYNLLYPSFNEQQEGDLGIILNYSIDSYVKSMVIPVEEKVDEHINHGGEVFNVVKVHKGVRKGDYVLEITSDEPLAVDQYPIIDYGNVDIDRYEQGRVVMNSMGILLSKVDVINAIESAVNYEELRALDQEGLMAHVGRFSEYLKESYGLELGSDEEVAKQLQNVLVHGQSMVLGKEKVTSLKLAFSNLPDKDRFTFMVRGEKELKTMEFSIPLEDEIN